MMRLNGWHSGVGGMVSWLQQSLLLLTVTRAKENVGCKLSQFHQDSVVTEISTKQMLSPS